MTEDTLPLAELLAKAGDGDFLRSGAELAQGCVEVELGGPNEQQLRRYREVGFDPVICIVGRKGGSQGHRSLEEVAALARKIAADIRDTNSPGMQVLSLVADTIDDALDGFRGHTSVQPIPARLLKLPWFAAAIEPLSRLQAAGYLVNRTTSNLSLSLQLERVPCMHGMRLALLTKRYPATFLLPVPEEMTRVLGDAFADVTAAWGSMLRFIMPNWAVHAQSNKRVRMAASDIERNTGAFAVVFDQLAGHVLAVGR